MDPTDDSKKRILARRARFMTAAIASAGLTATSIIGLAQEGCGGDVEQTPQGTSDTGPSVCLEPVFDGDTNDTGPNACLRVAPDSGDFDTGPSGCLTPPHDTGATPDTSGDTSGDASDAKDTAPVPCLTAPFDTGSSG